MTRHQDTEIVHERAGGEEPGRVVRRPLSRMLTIPIMVAAGALALLLLANAGSLHVYQRHLLEDQPAVSMPWPQLDATLGESDLHRLLPGAGLMCISERTAMGDRVCYAPVDSVDGYPALMVAFFLRGGRLNLATVHVPWWGHGRAAAALERQFGPSQPARANGRLRRWNAPGGYADMNRNRSINVLAWSAVVWTPRAPTP